MSSNLLDLFKTRCVFINRNSVFADYITNGSTMLQMFDMSGFVRWTKSLWRFSLFISFLSLQVLNDLNSQKYRSSYLGVFLVKSVLKIYSKFTREHPCRSVISIKLQSNVSLRHACSTVNLLHIFRTPFLKNTSGGLLLEIKQKWSSVQKIFFISAIADKKIISTLSIWVIAFPTSACCSN